MKQPFYKRIAAAACAVSMLALSAAGTLPVGAAPSETDAHAMAEELTATMPLRQKIAQMIMLNIRYWSDETNTEQVGQTTVNPQIDALLEKYSFGGVLLFAQNVEGTEQTTRFTAQLQEAAADNEFAIPLMIAADQEGGTIVRLGTGTNTCGNMATGATGDPMNARANADIIGSELEAVGINVDFAPVMDVNCNPKNPIINVRSFSSDAALVSEMGTSFISGLNAHNIITTAKHFPGHGDTDTDSHTGLPLINRSYDELKTRELIPFQTAMDADVDMIMTAHIQFPQIETETYKSITTGENVYLPATLSKTILTDIVRKDMGYDGVIVTDGMQMDALQKNFNIIDTAVYAINAGADMLLEPVVTWSPEDITKLEVYLDNIEKAVTDGKIQESRIDEACTRILELKYKRGLFDAPTEDVEARVTNALETVGSKGHHEVELAIAKQAVTLVKNDENTLPLTLGEGERVAFFYPLDSAENSFHYAFDQLKAEGIIPASAEADYNPFSEHTADAFRDTIAAAKAVVVSVESMGESYLDPTQDTAISNRSRFVDDLIETAHSEGKKVILMSMSLPYDTARYTKADAILAAYSNKKMPVIPTEYNGELTAYGPNYPAAIMTVFGENTPTGKLPVDVYTVDENYKFTDQVLFPLGFGLTYESEEPETPASAEDVYAPILDAMEQRLRDGFENYQDEDDTSYGLLLENPNTFSYLWYRGYSDLNLNTAGYAITDLDGNGTEELVIGEIGEDGFGAIYDLYTSSEGKAYHIASSGERDHFALTNRGTIVEEGSGSASNSIVIFHSIGSNKLEPIEGYSIDENVNYKMKDYTVSEDNTTYIYTWEKSDDTMEDYKYHPIKFTAFADRNAVSYDLGDVNGDGIINAGDAAEVLIAAAAIGAGEAPDLSPAAKTAADVNSDGKIDASDATSILIYAAHVGAGETDVSILDFI